MVTYYLFHITKKGYEFLEKNSNIDRLIYLQITKYRNITTTIMSDVK